MFLTFRNSRVFGTKGIFRRNRCTESLPTCVEYIIIFFFIVLDCDPKNPSNIILQLPNGDTTYTPAGSISVSCTVSGDFHGKIFWIRNNSDGESTILNNTKIEPSLPLLPNSPEKATLTESPPDNKFPYTYQCLAFGKCCNEHKSPPITVNIVAATSPPPTTGKSYMLNFGIYIYNYNIIIKKKLLIFSKSNQSKCRKCTIYLSSKY